MCKIMLISNDIIIPRGEYNGILSFIQDTWNKYVMKGLRKYGKNKKLIYERSIYRRISKRNYY